MSKVSVQSYNAVGRRKRSVARIHVKPGTGVVMVNDKPLAGYFGVGTSWVREALAPMHVLKQADIFDVTVNVFGGGMSGQAGAISLAVARALDKYAKANGAEATIDEASADQQGDGEGSEDGGLLGVERWRAKLKKHRLLTRDSRVVLRKKVGLVKARKAKQFSKR